MKNFFDRTSKAFFIIAGCITAGTIAVTLAPKLAMAQIFHMSYAPGDTLIIQHWGFMVFCLGVFMIIAAFRPHLRVAAASYAIIEKLMLVFLTLTSTQENILANLGQAILIDGLISLYLLGYLFSRAMSNSA